ncbi:BPL-N domain-containing protein [Chlamydia sp. 17-3921]|uniref:BPL-N domain-containing protein n=1 Tax=Chlamydia sp. 17-3921 TaxID=2675798 RepID=UPI0019196675|nr:BPL-N domain-containing protein [Chlamydia sp. 17-3921]
MEKSCILVYSGQGVSPYYLRHTIRFLKEMLNFLEIEREVRRVDGQFILYDPIWEETASLLVFPGGADIPYHKLLHGLGTARIAEFVLEGGKYLGICAGAYFGAKELYFENPNGCILSAGRDLGFFPGLAKGPAYGNIFSYTSPIGVRASKQIFSEFGEGYALFNGGCFFEVAETFSDVCIEARYADLPNQPASIISRRIGQGFAVLSGPHIEYLPDYCKQLQENVKEARAILKKESYALNCYRLSLLSRLLLH